METIELVRNYSMNRVLNNFSFSSLEDMISFWFSIEDLMFKNNEWALSNDDLKKLLDTCVLDKLSTISLSHLSETYNIPPVDTLKKVFDIVKERNSRYSDAWRQFGIYTVVISLSHKVKRLKTLIYFNENYEDALVDIVGYCILAMTMFYTD